MSFARIIVFALALTHAVGLGDMVMGDGCAEDCRDDGCGDDCLPGPSCRCHFPTAVPLVSQSVASTKLTPPRDIDAGFAEERIHVSPDPREILHVPKRAV